MNAPDIIRILADQIGHKDPSEEDALRPASVEPPDPDPMDDEPPQDGDDPYRMSALENLARTYEEDSELPAPPDGDDEQEDPFFI